MAVVLDSSDDSSNDSSCDDSSSDDSSGDQEAEEDAPFLECFQPAPPLAGDVVLQPTCRERLHTLVHCICWAYVEGPGRIVHQGKVRDNDKIEFVDKIKAQITV
jgi:hypothetical protein